MLVEINLGQRMHKNRINKKGYHSLQVGVEWQKKPKPICKQIEKNSLNAIVVAPCEAM